MSASTSPGAGDRRAAGVDRALNSVFARPVDHLLTGGAVLDRAEADLSQQLYACVGEVLEVLLDHAVFDHRSTGVDLDAAGAEIFVPALRGDRHGFEANDIPWATGHVDLSGGNQRGDAAVQGAVDPMELLLAGRVVADDGMNVAVDQTGGERDAVGIDRGGCTVCVEVLLAANSGNLSVLGDDAIGFEDRILY